LESPAISNFWAQQSQAQFSFISSPVFEARGAKPKPRNFCKLARLLGPVRVFVIAAESLEFGRRRVAVAVFRYRF